jgi:hypothetical protein
MISHEEKMHSSLGTLMISNHMRRRCTTTSKNTLMIKSHEQKDALIYFNKHPDDQIT